MANHEAVALHDSLFGSIFIVISMRVAVTIVIIKASIVPIGGLSSSSVDINHIFPKERFIP